MKVRSSHIVVAILLLIGLLVAFAVLQEMRANKPVSERTDDFLQEVERIRQTGGGSKETAGILATKEIDIADSPKIEFEVPVVDMGTIARDKVATRKLAVRNVGKMPLEVYDIQTSCPCTHGDFAEAVRRADGKSVTTIPPNEKRDMIITVDPALIYGFEAEKTLSVASNDPAKALSIIEVVTKVDPEFEMVPPLLEFGGVPVGQPGEARAIIRQLMSDPLDITSVQLINPTGNAAGSTAGKMANFISMELARLPESAWKTPGRTEWELIARIAPEAPPGPIDEMFFINSTAPRIPKINGHIRGIVQRFYTVTPTNLSAREPVVPGQSNVARSVVSAQRDISITDLSITGDDLVVEAIQSENKVSAEIRLGVKPTAKPGLKTEDVYFRITETAGAIPHRMRAMVSVEAGTPAATEGQ